VSDVIQSRLETLRGTLTGALLLRDDPDWEAARHPWNRSVDQRPVAVATPADIADLRAILAAARETGLGVTVQPHGHGAADALEDCILIRPERFDELTIDVDARRARVGAGVDWGRVLTALDGTGLVALAGSNPEVSVVGYSLAGGHSAFSRAFGLASNAISAVELVTGDGIERRVDTDADAELFWALRGGGGLFGIVTAVEFRLFPLSSADAALYGGKLTFGADAAGAVLRAFAATAADLPDEMTLAGGLMSFPDAPVVPEPLRGSTIVSVDVVSLLDGATTEAAIAPLRAVGTPVADTIAAFTIGDLPAVAAEPVQPMAAIDHGLLLSALDAQTIDDLVEGFVAGARKGLTLLQIRPLGGAIRRASGELGVTGSVDAPVLIGMSVVGPGPDMDHEAASAALECVLGRVRHVESSGLIATFLSAGDGLQRAYDSASIARLRAVKARLDPADVIRSNRPLPADESV
jgi:hypothetical protein